MVVVSVRPSGGWVSGRIARGLISFATEAGLDPHVLRKIAGFETEVGQPDEVVIAKNHFALWAYIVRTLDDPGIPARAAALRTPGDLQVRGFVAMTSRDGWEACDRAARYVRLTTNTMSVRLTRPQAGIARVTIERPGSRRLGLRCSNECALLSWVTQIRRVLDPSFVPRSVHVQHALPAERSATEAHLGAGAKLIDRAAFDGLEFSDEVMNRTPAAANPEMRAFFDRQAQTLLSRVEDYPSTSIRQIHDAIVRALPSGTPKMAETARALGYSERKLRRTLEEHDVGYSETVAAVRLQLARKLLRQQGLSLSEISFALGYSEHSAFTRFFRTHAGQSPSSFRASLAKEHGVE